MADIKISALPTATLPLGSGDTLITNQGGVTMRATMVQMMNSGLVYSGTGAPTVTAPNGAIYLRTDGTDTSTLYVRVGGTWKAASLTLV